MKNWKTTLFGSLLAVGMFFSQNSTGVLQQIGKIITIVGSAGVGMTAKDNNVTGGTKVQ